VRAVVVFLCVLLSSFVDLFYCVCVAFFFKLNAFMPAKGQYSVFSATDHLGTRSSRFCGVYMQTLRLFPSFQVATKCFSFSPPNLNLVVNKFIFCLHLKLTPPPVDNPIAVNKYYYYHYYYYYSNVSSDCI